MDTSFDYLVRLFYGFSVGGTHAGVLSNTGVVKAY